jgi:hypothetical protein
MIDACKLHDSGILREISAKPLNRRVKFEENRSMRAVTNYTLYPKKCREPYASSDGFHAMHAGARI